MEEIIECADLKFPVRPGIHSDKTLWKLRNGRHEKRERWMLKRFAFDDDVVLDIGAGLGLIAMSAARLEGVDRVVTVEANPKLLDLLKETFALNGVKNISLVHGVLENRPRTKTRTFYLNGITASSLTRPKSFDSKVRVPVRDFSTVLRETGATVITCDIEGGELALLGDADLSVVRHIMLELHPKIYGPQGVKRLFDSLSAKGFAYNAMCSGGYVVSFSRIEDDDPPDDVAKGRIPPGLWRNVRVKA